MKHSTRLWKLISWVAVLLCPICAESATRDYMCVIDDHSRPLPAPPPLGWYYNNIGGDRGMLMDYTSDRARGVAVYSKPAVSAYRGTIVRMLGSDLWEYAGFWYSLGHALSEKIALNPNAVFHPMIKPAFQARLTRVELVVNRLVSPSGRADLSIKIELKDPSGASEVMRTNFVWRGRTALVSGTFPKTFSAAFNPAALGSIGVVTLLLDRASVGDSIDVDQVRFLATTPYLPPAEEAFVWSLAMLLESYDSRTGMVQDRSNFPKKDMENVTSTGKLAKLLAMAIAGGYVDEPMAQSAITNIATALLTKVPRGPAGKNELWPHFTSNGGTARLADSEWASGDTVYALLDLMVALQMIGDPQSQLPAARAMLTGINWTALRSPEGYFYHGYDAAGNRLTSTWQGFGAETFGVLLAAKAGGDVEGNMLAPPTDNGSGFILHAGYPIGLTGIDRWTNNWYELRRAETQTQLTWHASVAHSNPFMVRKKLFGLSAAEVPDGERYQAYGTGGKGEPNDDTNRVVVLHYSGMVSALCPAASEAMWESLKAMGIISPLSNMESMRVNCSNGVVERVNYLKGSWNLSLQTEGWGLANGKMAAAVFSAFRELDDLARAFDSLVPLWINLEAMDWSSPTNNPSGITLRAVAGGLVTQMVFYADSLQIAAVQTNTAVALWTNIPPGKHVLTAVARDTLGRTATSMPVNFDVAHLVPAVALWQLPSGQTLGWTRLLGGTAGQGAVNILPGASTWQVRGAGDVDKDGVADLFWQLPTGQAACWFMRADGTRKGGTNITTGATRWIIRGVGDIDRDGVVDLVWQLPTGQVALWFMKANGTVKSATNICTSASAWIIRGAGDIDGDGVADLVWQLPTGQGVCWFMSADGSARSGTNISTSATAWIVRGVGDMDGDGLSDLLWQLSTGQVACWLMNADGTRRYGINVTGATSWIVRGAGG